jgi:hypothetical protein
MRGDCYPTLYTTINSKSIKDLLETKELKLLKLRRHRGKSFMTVDFAFLGCDTKSTGNRWKVSKPDFIKPLKFLCIKELSQQNEKTTHRMEATYMSIIHLRGMNAIFSILVLNTSNPCQVPNLSLLDWDQPHFTLVTHLHLFKKKKSVHQELVPRIS